VEEEPALTGEWINDGSKWGFKEDGECFDDYHMKGFSVIGNIHEGE